MRMNMEKPTKRVRVTLADIRQGVAADCQSCPVALAIKRAFDADWIEVDHYLVRVWKEEEITSYTLSQEVATWIANFDAEAPVKPFAFRISL
jgi:hypothetical protein